jgi:hypothetical protein
MFGGWAMGWVRAADLAREGFDPGVPFLRDTPDALVNAMLGAFRRPCAWTCGPIAIRGGTAADREERRRGQAWKDAAPRASVGWGASPSALQQQEARPDRQWLFGR